VSSEGQDAYVLDSHIVRRARSEPPEVLGRRVAEAGRHQGISQADLASAVGLDRRAISKIETGRRRVESLELRRLARALGRPAAWFLLPASASGSESRPSAPDEAPPLRRKGNLLEGIERKRATIRRLAAHHGAHSVRVFGSSARGEDYAGSDVDFLVEFEPGRSLFDQAALILELRSLLGRDVDVVTPQGLRDRIRDEVLDDAVPL
jgi:predicted nucleotidyltransferase/DNA-binding XRE family transcriptional regulator